MDRYEKAALLDFVAAVIWPTRTVRVVTTAIGESTFAVLGTWDVATDRAMAWINGNRVAGTITWANASQVTLPVTAALGSQVIILVTPGAGTGYLPRNSGGVVGLLDDLMMGANRIRNLGAGVEAADGVRLDQVQSLIVQMLGGNYVAKAGDQMDGVLTLVAADNLTAPEAAIRRDMAALLAANASAGERTFLAKPMAPSTVDGDGGTVLVTKDWALAKHSLLLASLMPNRVQVFSAPGPWTFQVPALVIQVFVCVIGAGGGSGGLSTAYAGAAGGRGKLVCATVATTPGESVSVVVGGPGGNGGATNPQDGGSGAGGGGGGGKSSFGPVVSGGGGGGGGGRESHGPGTGGAGGMAGATAAWYGGQGGTAGSGGAENGGVGGSSPFDAPPTVGGDGTFTRGGSGISPLPPTPDNFPVSAGEPGTAGCVMVTWRE